MKKGITTKIAELLRASRRHKIWRRAMSGMSALVVFVTTYLLILPAITLETDASCGMAEHTHTGACYEMRLVCGQEETPAGEEAHQHDASCYAQQPLLSCTPPEGEGHTHTGACYGLTCGQEEAAGHQHGEDCYTVEKVNTCGLMESAGHAHSEACFDENGLLICGQDESEGHTHSDACFTEQKTLTCTLPEGEGHTHTEACYGLTCGQEEAEPHQHGEACYTTENVLVCTRPEAHTHSDACWEKVLVCEIPEHTHGDACAPDSAAGEPEEPETVPSDATCGMEEHTHTDACYDETGALICGMEEHTHTEDCFPAEEPETVPSDAICGMEEHTHSDACYDETGALICGLEEHTHTEDCFPAEEPETVPPDAICGMEEHTHSDACYDETGALICGLEEHTHTEECYTELIAGEDTPLAGLRAWAEALGFTVPEDYTAAYFTEAERGLLVAAFAPEGALPAEAALVATRFAEDSDAYLAAGDALAAQGAEFDGYAAMDIHFELDGEEIEPSEDVLVCIDARSLLPEDADPETVAIQHHTEPEEPEENLLDKIAAFFSVMKVGETAADAAETVVETVADAVDGTGTLFVDGAGLSAAFHVPDFSTFTITWERQNGLTVRIVDQNGNEIDEDVIAGVSFNGKEENYGSWTSIEDVLKDAKLKDEYKLEDGTYKFSGAYTTTTSGWPSYGTQEHTVTYIKHDSDERTKWRYSDNYQKPNDRRSGEGLSTLYLEYEVERSLTTVDTVDSTAEGVHMYMFKYQDHDYESEAGRQFTGGNYKEGEREGDVKEGMVNRTLNNYGWPTFTDNYDIQSRYYQFPQNSLAQLFGGSTSAYDVDEQYAVNHLFLQSKYDENGTFYYSAFENFATLVDDDDKDFTVYDALGTPADTEQYYFKRGNFMPYNDLNPNEISPNRNLYNSEGEELHEGDPGYNDPLYKLEDTPDFHFGMYVWADFYQPKDGQVEDNEGGRSEDMIFEFTGDDDMWVFIDGVLVLDLGGIHDAQSGSINFATGEVRYTDTVLNAEEVKEHYTTLKKQFEAAGREVSTDWDGDTFADGTNHRIQIFYMERGEGASNLKMSFNLKTIPDGQLSVRKEVEHYYAPQLKDVTYTMQVTVNGERYANETYEIFGTGETGTTDANGQFDLHHNETAVFPDLEVNDNVVVKEVGTSDTEPGVTLEKKYDIACEVTDSAGNPMDGAIAENGTATATMPGYGSINVIVTNTATFTRPLKLVKQFDGTDDKEAPAGFEATSTL